MKAKMRSVCRAKAASRSGFTLVEMLVVVVILGILMSIMFRLGDLTDDTKNKSDTIIKLQKVENCLSGYYAAFGSYPTVRVYGSRDINTLVDGNGEVNESGSSLNSAGGDPTWEQVNAACRAQPFAAEYPCADGSEEYKLVEEKMKDYVEAHPGTAEWKVHEYDDFNHKDINKEWEYAKIFTFGLMSYLLPRYLFMTVGDEEFYEADYCHQWTDNNDTVHSSSTGGAMSWSDVRDASFESNGSARKNNNRDLAEVANIPTQAVCARWIPNLQHACYTYTQKTFFGIPIKPPDEHYLTWQAKPLKFHYYPGTQKQYSPAIVTMVDAYGNELYYYSPPPFQTYTVWSAGSNGRTFPPWIPLDAVPSNQRETYADWLSDDIVKMNN